MDEYVAVRNLRFRVRVGMDLLNNITNFVANVIERVSLIPSCVGLHMRLGARGDEWFYGDY